MNLATITKSVTSANANRYFSELLRDVRSGTSVVITIHGKPVAKIVPIDEHANVANQARQTLLARLARQRATDSGAWTRESLYANEV